VLPVIAVVRVSTTRSGDATLFVIPLERDLEELLRWTRLRSLNGSRSGRVVAAELAALRLAVHSGGSQRENDEGDAAVRGGHGSTRPTLHDFW